MRQRERKVMARLTAARPPELAGDAAPEPAVRRRELAQALRRTSDHQGVEVTSNAPRRGRRGWGAGLVSAAVAAAVAVAVLPADGSGSGADPGARPGAGPGTEDGAEVGNDVLLAAAAALERVRGERRGAYWFQEESRGELHRVTGAGGTPYVVDERTTTRRWVARTKEDHWSDQTDMGTRPATAQDARAWRAAGSPRTWKVPGGGSLRHRAGGLLQRDAPGGGWDVEPIGALGPGDLRDLPTQAGALLERVRAATKQKYRAPDDVVSWIVTTTLVNLAVHLPSGTELRAAAYRALAESPGVRSLGAVKDRSGRPGRGVAVPESGGLTELRIVFDAKTGAPLGTLTVAVRDHDGWAKGAVVRYTTSVAQRWTDTAPPFDDDWSDRAAFPTGGPGRPDVTAPAASSVD
ncbi:CU044_5270 family protein [Streptomyces sp. NPDC059816]|uniref:CU044_5270 family protein n=1 Tax=Streptomyces sp. NPDC059816 TaxID=3346960 RepID=UPI00364EA456